MSQEEEVKEAKEEKRSEEMVSKASEEAPAAGTTKPKGPLTRKLGDKVKFLNILDHGDSGTGKTHFAGTMIKAGLKVHYIAFSEDELLTLDQKGITGYDYTIITDYENQLWNLYLALRKNTPHYDGVVLDGLTDFQQNAKDVELSDGESKFKFMEEAMKGDKRMKIQNWGNLLEMTRHFLDPFLQLPMHKIVTSVSEPDDDPKTGKPKVYPALQGSMQQLISAHFSIVGFSYIAFYGADVHYCLTTQPHESIQTKDRTGLCRVMINPQFKTFLDALNGKIAPPTDRENILARNLIVKPQTTSVKITEKSSDKEGR